MEFEQAFLDVVYDDIPWDKQSEVLPLDFSQQLPHNSPNVTVTSEGVLVVPMEPAVPVIGSEWSIPYFVAMDKPVQDSNAIVQRFQNHTNADILSLTFDPIMLGQPKRRIRTNKKPVLQGPNRFGRTGCKKCKNCRRHKKKCEYDTEVSVCRYCESKGWDCGPKIKGPKTEARSMAISTNGSSTLQSICRVVSRPSHEIVTDDDNDYLQFFLAVGNYKFVGVHYGEQRVLPVSILPEKRSDLVELSLPTRFAVLAFTSYMKSGGLKVEHTTKYLKRCYELMKRSIISNGPSIELVYSSYTICILAATVQDRPSLLGHVQGFCAAIRALKRRKNAVQEGEWKWLEVLQLNLLISTCAQLLEDDGKTYTIAHESIISALWQEPLGIHSVGEQNLARVLLHIGFHLQHYLVLLNSSSKNVHLAHFEQSGIPEALRKLTSLIGLLSEELSPRAINLIDFQRWHQFLYQKTSLATGGPGALRTPNYFPGYNQVRAFLWNFYIFRREFSFAMEEYAIKTLFEASVPSVQQLKGSEPYGVEIWLFLQDLVFSSGTEPRDGYASKHIRRLYKALQRWKMSSFTSRIDVPARLLA